MADLGVARVFVHPVNGTLMVIFGSELCAKQEHTCVTDKPKASLQRGEKPNILEIIKVTEQL